MAKANETSTAESECFQCNRSAAPGEGRCRFCILEAEASKAFWGIIVKHFPEAKFGDLSPERTIHQRIANVDAIEEWISNNVPTQCSTCHSEIVSTINDSCFRDGECGACEYRRYASQPELLTIAEAFRQECSDQVQQHQDDLKEDFGDADDLQEQVEYWKQRREQCDAAITKAYGTPA